MAELLRPGVFVFETSFRGKPIEGVATSTAGFVGRAQAGPEGKATLVTSFTQFTRQFGQPYSNPQNMGEYLGHAVRSFFSNGGLRAYIVRVLGAGAAPATVQGAHGTVLRLPSTVTVRGPTQSLPLDSLREISGPAGILPGSTLHIWTRPSPSALFQDRYQVDVLSYDAVREVVTTTPATALSAGVTLDPNNTYVVVQGHEPHSDAGGSPTFTALDNGASGNAISVQFRPNDLPPVRLATSKYLRGEPVVTTAGPNGSSSVTLTAGQIRQVRYGDLLEFDNGTSSERRLVKPIANSNVTYTVDAGAEAPLLTNGTIAVIARGSFTATTGTVIYTVPAAVSPITFAAGAVSLPHAVAALLQPNDILLTSTGLKITVNVITYPTTITLAKVDDIATTQAVVGNYTAGTVTLITPAAPDALNNPLGRLVVTDVSGLHAPARSDLNTVGAVAPEPIVVTDGVNSSSSTIVFVDSATNTVVYGATLGSVSLANWVSFEDLEVAASGDTVIHLASVASFYTGGILRFDDGSVPQYFVTNAIDPVARTVTLSLALNLSTGTGYVDVNPVAASRAAYLSTLEFDLLVYQSGTVVETFPNLSWNNSATSDSFRKYYVKRVNDPNTGSAFISITPPGTEGVTPAAAPTTADGQPLPLINGSDGAPPINIDIIGSDNGPGNRKGIQSLIERDDIAIVAVPGVTDVAVQDELITHCETLKYRFAVLDGIPHTSDVSAIQAHRNNYDTKYAAYYEPWIETLDLTTGNTLNIPPSGAVVGIYARVDNDRGVFKAPANEVVSDVFGLEYQFGNGEQEVLNPVGVNLIRTFTGRGIRVWGARCITSDQEWKYINVRRLFIFLEHSIDLGTQWVVFEPNNEALWARVVSTISSFLVGVWKTGAFMGTKPEEAFFVRCDRTTMTQDDIDNGRLIVLIGVAPTFPAEFVVFQIGQFTASSPT